MIGVDLKVFFLCIFIVVCGLFKIGICMFMKIILNNCFLYCNMVCLLLFVIFIELILNLFSIVLIMIWLILLFLIIRIFSFEKLKDLFGNFISVIFFILVCLKFCFVIIWK